MDRHLLIICEECGKKYRVDTAKILGHAAGFQCHACGHRIRVTRPPRQVSDPLDDVAEQHPAPGPGLDLGPPAPVEPAARPARRSGSSLRAKAMLVWFILPAGIAAAAGVLLLDQAEQLVSPGQRETFFMLLLLAGAALLLALAIGLGFGLKLAGRIRRLAEAADGIVSVRTESGGDLDRIEAALRRLEELERAPGAGK
jgi:DNA-directed RNA polymerase subunit RPC12/RpoP